MLIDKLNSDLLLAADIFAHPRYTKAAFVEQPFITRFFGDFSVDKSFFEV